MARGQRRLGAVARPLLGHAAAGVALRRVRHDTCIGSRGRAVAARRARPDRPRPAPPLRRRGHLPLPGRRAAGTGRAGSPPVLDAWFDSGSMPSAQHHYPFEGAERVRARRSPPTSSARRSTRPRGWFYSLLAVNTLVFDSTPYRNVVCLGLLVDEDGPEDVEVEGQRHRPVGDLRHPRRRRAAVVLLLRRPAVDAAARVRGGHPRSRPARRCSRSWNVFSFFATYADLDGWTPDASGTADRRRTCSTAGCLGELDDTVAGGHRRARAASTRSRRDHALGRVRRRPLELVRAPRRPRFWKSRDPAAHATLHECLVDDRAAAGAVLPVPGRRDLHHPHRRAVGATWPTGPQPAPQRPEARDRDGKRRAGSSPSAAPPAPTPRSKVRQPSAPSAAAAPGHRAVRGRTRPRSPTSST